MRVKPAYLEHLLSDVTAYIAISKPEIDKPKLKYNAVSGLSAWPRSLRACFVHLNHGAEAIDNPIKRYARKKPIMHSEA